MSKSNLTWPGHQPVPMGRAGIESPTPVVVLPREPLHVFGDEVQVHLSGTQSGGAHTVFTGLNPPGGALPFHHLDTDQNALLRAKAALDLRANCQKAICVR